MIRKVEQEDIKRCVEFANNRFGKVAGLAQQYLFYWRRELEKNN